MAHESVDPSRKLFDVNAIRGQPQAADVDRAYEFGVLATAAQLIGAGQAMLDMSVEYAKQRSQFGSVIGTYQAIKHKLADVHIALELARPLVYGAALSLADRLPRHRARRQRRQGGCGRGRAARGPLVAADPRRHRLHRRNTTCRCGCCGCRRCARRGATRPAIDAESWRHC